MPQEKKKTPRRGSPQFSKEAHAAQQWKAINRDENWKSEFGRDLRKKQPPVKRPPKPTKSKG